MSFHMEPDEDAPTPYGKPLYYSCFSMVEVREHLLLCSLEWLVFPSDQLFFRKMHSFAPERLLHAFQCSCLAHLPSRPPTDAMLP